MITGYTRPLYLLPFDHRASYISRLFSWKEPLNVEQMISVAQSKQVIYASFQQAIADQVSKDRVGLLEPEAYKGLRRATERERAALTWAEAVMLISKGHVPDERYGQVCRQLPEQELVTLAQAVVVMQSKNRLPTRFRTLSGTGQPACPCPPRTAVLNKHDSKGRMVPIRPRK